MSFTEGGLTVDAETENSVARAFDLPVEEVARIKAAFGPKPVSWQDMMIALTGMGPMIFEAIEKRAKPLTERLDAAERRIAALESRGPNLADAYRGAWMYGSYKRGALVTHSGSIFLALKDTDEKPATSDAWKLVVKAGRDGKDAR